MRSAENINVVAHGEREQSLTSTRHRFIELNIPRTSLRRILHKDLFMKSYTAQLVQKLKPQEKPMRFHFAQWAENCTRTSELCLTSLDYYLWGAYKCYSNHPETVEPLEHKIDVAIYHIVAKTIENVPKNWIDRMRYCKARRGSHLNDVVLYFILN